MSEANATWSETSSPCLFATGVAHPPSSFFARTMMALRFAIGCSETANRR